jgi:hypothetical protein
MYALDVTRLDYRPGQSWSPLQAADGGASIEAWVIKNTFTTGVVDCQVKVMPKSKILDKDHPAQGVKLSIDGSGLGKRALNLSRRK